MSNLPSHIDKQNKVGAAEEEGIVVETDRKVARVKITKGAACATCAVASNCPFSIAAPNDWKVWARNKLDAKIGDKVKISIAPSRYLLIAVIVFILPVSVLIVSYLLAKLAGAQENLSVAISVTFAFLTYFIIRGIDRSSMRQPSYTIVEILPNETEGLKSITENRGENDG